MHIFSKKNSSLFLTAAMLIAAASCTQELQENDLVKPSDDVVLTKAVNTPEDALEGNLIVKLSEETVVAGYEGLMSQFSEKVDVISMRPVFPAAVMPDNFALVAVPFVTTVLSISCIIKADCLLISLVAFVLLFNNV